MSAAVADWNGNTTNQIDTFNNFLKVMKSPVRAESGTTKKYTFI